MNIADIFFRARILIHLVFRAIFRSKIPKRSSIAAVEEYNDFWNGFWESKSYFKVGNWCNDNGTALPQYTGFAFKRDVIVKIISDKINRFGFKSVLEIGSGAGLNLLLLAPLFPNVRFYGLEPSPSGVRMSNEFLNNPPPEFSDAHELKKVSNVVIIQGNILDPKDVGRLKEQEFDFVFSCAVLENLNNYLDTAFSHIFSLNFDHFLFYENWLEANYSARHYLDLVKKDYFRVSWNTLARFPARITEQLIPTIQPHHLRYASVFGEKIKAHPKTNPAAPREHPCIKP